MSMGYGGYADLGQHDGVSVVYLYCCYNVNCGDYKHFREIQDGVLYIERNAFIEPDIRGKIKKTAARRKKLIVKRIKKRVPFDELLKDGKIKVKNAGGTWETTEFGIDIMALKILFKIFDEYQETGELPKHIAWFG